MTKPLPLAWQGDDVFHLLSDILEAHPAGLSEYELYQTLRQREIAPFADCDLGDELTLFRIHFLQHTASPRAPCQTRASGVWRLDFSLAGRVAPPAWGGVAG